MTALAFAFGTKLIAQDNTYDVIWIASDPSGATVTVNGKERGITPLFVGGLEAGDYDVAVSMRGYETDQQRITLPAADATQRLVKLTQRAGTCLITSDPPNASIAHGTQLLGRTPLVISSLPSGSHQLRLLKRGFAEKQITAIVTPNGPSQAGAELKPNTGTLTITTIPADAKVVIDNYDMGAGKRGSKAVNKSEPRTFDGLAARKHKVEIEYQGVRGAAQAAEVAAGADQEMLLMLWYPNVQVKTRDGRTVKGMIIQESDADLIVAKTLTDHVRIKASDVLEKSSVPAVEARRLAKEAAGTK